ncbi:hypothetical protein [Natrialba asiatica]|uniref:Uncharacterized protein n=1 Tax=Natrialba asiatica (strain ATCC 700177 / DSM 12278 / JCM 9576 / FERM P-10747 / NBRC 102637 / 172P1) TaxID=29540 RepID=M0AX33_NATA1|nr:hypothetical protein [Natrialba asiatica]ELZ02513.1 hypothetical protein C481_07596 [Natrialba asiatica DSM 12278]
MPRTATGDNGGRNRSGDDRQNARTDDAAASRRTGIAVRPGGRRGSPDAGADGAETRRSADASLALSLSRGTRGGPSTERIRGVR